MQKKMMAPISVIKMICKHHIQNWVACAFTSLISHLRFSLSLVRSEARYLQLQRPAINSSCPNLSPHPTNPSPLPGRAAWPRPQGSRCINIHVPHDYDGGTQQRDICTCHRLSTANNQTGDPPVTIRYVWLALHWHVHWVRGYHLKVSVLSLPGKDLAH